jgi:hypothetical protein
MTRPALTVSFPDHRPLPGQLARARMVVTVYEGNPIIDWSQVNKQQVIQNFYERRAVVLAEWEFINNCFWEVLGDDDERADYLEYIGQANGRLGLDAATVVAASNERNGSASKSREIQDVF